jgi:hypothetical protein
MDYVTWGAVLQGLMFSSRMVLYLIVQMQVS